MNKFEKSILGYGLKNALQHKGKCNIGSVIAGLHHEFSKSKIRNNLSVIKKIILQINKLSLDEQKKEYEKLSGVVSERKGREGLPELPDAKKGKVVMRFAPSPSGGLHVGHAMTSCISFLFVQKYGGKFYVRIEDTNPGNIYKPAYKMIKDESKWLFDNKAKIVIQSERMKIYYNYIEKLIRKNSAYICTCSADKFREFVKQKKNCPCRSLSVKENLERWKKMLDKKGFKIGEAVLRFKSNMKDKNPAMRDFPLARINLTKHALQGNKYRVWPLMNLSVAVDDIGMKITHVIRGKEHRDNAKRQKMIYDALGKKFPWCGFLGRFKFKDMELSTTKMRKAIEAGKYKGWCDSRLPTLASLKKKYKPQAFWKFAERIGLSENDKVIDKKEYFRLLDNFNR